MTDRERPGDTRPPQDAWGRTTQPVASRHGYRPELDQTVLLPIVPMDNPGSAEPTMLIPALGYGDAETTVLMPVPAVSRHRADDPTEVVGIPLQNDSGEGGSGVSPSVARNSATMAVFSLLSRVTGLIRTVAIAAALGATAIANSYNLANTVPNMVYELLLGGIMSSVLVPFLMRSRLRHTDGGTADAQRLLTLAFTFLGAGTVVAVAAAPLLTRLFTVTTSPRPTGADLDLITTLSYLILPEIFFYGVAALLAAILYTRGHFAAPAWTPILNNLVVIATAVLFIVMPSVSASKLDSATISSAQVLVLGIGTTLGIVVQALGLIPALRGVGFRWKWRFDFRKLALRDLGRASGWMLVYVLVTQAALVIMLILITAVGHKRLADGSLAPGITIYNYSYLIFMMAHGIVAVSIMTALMPRLSAAAAQGRFGDLASLLAMGTRLSAVILIPATAAYLTLGQPLAITVFQWHSYTHEQAMRTGTVIAVEAIGLVPFAISQMQMFAFYAMPDTKTPALMNLPVAALRVLMDVVFYLVLPYALVTAGLMMANTLSYILAIVLGYTLLRRRVGLLGLTAMAWALGRLAVAALIAAVPTWLLVVVLQHAIGTQKLASAITLVVGGLLLIVVYVGAAIMLKARDVTDVVAMVKGRLGR